MTISNTEGNTMTKKNPTIDHGFGGGSTGNPQEWQQRSIARTFQYDADMERLLKLRETNPERFERRTPIPTRVAMGYYASAKAAADSLGVDTDPPKDTA